MKYYCLLLLLLNGCTLWWEKGSGDYKIYVDTAFSDAQQEAVKKAVTVWDESTEGTVSFEYVDSNNYKNDLITISPSSMASLTYSDKPKDGGYTLGVTTYHGTSSQIEIADDLHTDIFLEVAEHEIGHGLGLMHNPDNGTVMHPGTEGQAKSVTCEDVKEFCVIWDCEPLKMNICK